MFQRRKPLTPLQHLKEIFWPTMGFYRAFLYIKLRIIRLSDTNHNIALGLSIGTAVSFTPLLGTHFIQAFLLAWFFRSNLLSALIGTLVGNPWTLPFMWWAGLEVGSYLFTAVGLPASASMPDHMDFHMLIEILLHNPLRILLPWVVGGYIAGAASVLITYPVFYVMVKSAKLARSKAKLYKIQKTARDMTRP
jgi:uncharacterized protein (DUF2062 family)